MGRFVRIVVVAGVLCMNLGAGGCATLGLDWTGSKSKLTETQLQYVHFLRWGEYHAASMIVEKDSREAFTNEIDALKAVRLSDYDVLETIFNATETEATITCTFSAYHMARLVEHTWLEEQVWVKDPVRGDWKVKPDIEKIREAIAEMEPAQ
jgi:hypothetical protein